MWILLRRHPMRGKKRRNRYSPRQYLIIFWTIIGDRQEARRHASVLVLAELARHASVIVYSYVGTILEHIWGTFREQKV